ncbi:MAG: hypothetical protein H7325_09690 [Pedobacter sp.]|nr:hypothetical protein [Pedobacter sp.]
MKVHIGEEIEAKFQESGMKIALFAEKINTGVRNVYAIFSRNDINADLLSRVSKALKFDFFKLYNLETTSDFMVEEELEEYRAEKKSISIALNVRVPNEHLKEFSQFLNEVKEISVRHGYRLA